MLLQPVPAMSKQDGNSWQPSAWVLHLGSPCRDVGGSFMHWRFGDEEQKDIKSNIGLTVVINHLFFFLNLDKSYT